MNRASHNHEYLTWMVTRICSDSILSGYPRSRRCSDWSFRSHFVQISGCHRTAELNPSRLSYCLSPPYNEALIPVVLNNSTPVALRYSVSALGSKSPKFNHTLNAKDIARLDKQWQDQYGHILAVSGSHGAAGAIGDADPYDDEYENDDYDAPHLKSRGHDGSAKRIQDVLHGQAGAAEKRRHLTSQQQQFYHRHFEPTQIIRHISVTRPGVVRLEAIKASNGDIRATPGEMTVVQCPSVRFGDPETQAPRKQECAGVTKALNIVAEGVTPMRLKWYKEVNGKREYRTADGLEGNPEVRLDHSRCAPS